MAEESRMERTIDTPAEELLGLAKVHFKRDFEIIPLVGDGSDRRIFRLRHPSVGSLIGVFHTDVQENKDFLLITEAMRRLELPVAEVYGANEESTAYLLQDLGPNNLAADLQQWKGQNEPAKVINAYEQTISWLPRIQQRLPKLLKVHLEGRVMDRAQLLEDLTYFETHFVQLFELEGSYTQELQEELVQKLIDPVAALAQDRFVYRDFQARNFMWTQEKIHFLDYQSGMLGNRFYDLASMLYASKAGLNDKQRALLLHQGYLCLKLEEETKQQFEQRFYQVLLLRRLRSLGSYGYLGKVKGKPGFYASLDPTVMQIKGLIKDQLPELEQLGCFLEKVPAFMPA